MTQVDIFNLSSVLSDGDIADAAADLQIQVTRDFAAAWGIDATVRFVPKDGTPDTGAWWLALLDDSDQADALGYHDLTPSGLPLGKVFAKSDKESGHNWTVTTSHELLEMLADPWVNRMGVDSRYPQAPVFYCCEVCDPCEDDSFGYCINATQVSDFVFPTWFDRSRDGKQKKFDQLGLIARPFSLLAGGYMRVYESSAGWHALNQPHDLAKSYDDIRSSRQFRVVKGSRRDRRMRQVRGEKPVCSRLQPVFKYDPSVAVGFSSGVLFGLMNLCSSVS
jgi:hypothetical protein